MNAKKGNMKAINIFEKKLLEILYKNALGRCNNHVTFMLPIHVSKARVNGTLTRDTVAANYCSGKAENRSGSEAVLCIPRHVGRTSNACDLFRTMLGHVYQVRPLLVPIQCWYVL